MMALVEVIDQHARALEYDLIALGLRLRDWPSPAFSWRDLWVIANEAPRTSALVRAMDLDTHLWGLGEHLQATTADVLNVLAWQKTEDGHKGRNMPHPITRPGVAQRVDDDELIGDTALPIDQAKALLGPQFSDL